MGRRELSQKYQGQHQQQQQQQQLLRCTRRTFATAADHNTHNHHHLESPSFDILAQLDINPETLQSLASQQPTPLSLSAMHKYAAMKDHRLFNAQFLHKELQIRIAQRAVDLLTLPLGLSKVEAIRQVARVYLQYLKQLQETPSPTTTQEEDAFTELLQSFVLDRTTIPTQIARGVQDWNKTAPLDPERLQEMEDVLYRFFTARVGLRFLIEHHVLTSPNPNIVKKGAMTSLSPLDDDEDEDEDEQAKQGTSSQSSSSSSSSAAAAVSGCIQSNLNVVQETQRVAALVKKQTLQAYGCCPEMEIVDCIHQNKKNHHKQQHSNNSNTRKKGFTYVPHHLHYMTAEILTNACRATVQQYLIKKQTDEKAELLRIRVVLVMGKEDITIKVCDRGGGIQRCTYSIRVRGVVCHIARLIIRIGDLTSIFFFFFFSSTHTQDLEVWTLYHGSY